MNHAEQRIEIAKLCGWTREFNGDHEDPDWYWIPPGNPDGPGELPNYPADLNACAEMEVTLDREHLEHYADILCDIATSNGEQCPNICELITLTPPQRCEAFLRVHGKRPTTP